MGMGEREIFVRIGLLDKTWRGVYIYLQDAKWIYARPHGAESRAGSMSRT